MLRQLMHVTIALFLANAAVGQVKLGMPETTAAPGESLTVPITVENFNHVGSFSLIISFDKKVLTFIEATDLPKFGVFNATPAAAANNNGSVALSWFNVSPAINIQKGKLLDLHFTYKKGTSPISFTKMVPSSVTDSLARNLPTTVKNGKVSARAVQRDGKKSLKPTETK